MWKRAKLVAVVAICLLSIAGCAKRAAPGAATRATDPSPAAPARQKLTTQAAARSERPATARQIIKNASLSLDVEDPDAASDKAAHVADDAGGYVASTKRDAARGDNGRASVTLVLRVPAKQFRTTLDRLHALAPGRGSEQITTEDVTEEYIDLDARLRTQQELEQQYLTILKNADKVTDALSVQKELASVRGEIEKIEGRKRFLESSVALSTITLTLDPKAPLVTAAWSDFGSSLGRAGADAVNVGAALVTLSIRAFGVLLPILVLFGAPARLAVRYLRRRATA